MLPTTFTIKQRVAAPTPPFFKILRTVGLLLAAVSGSLAGLPLAVPAVVAKIAGYVAVAGSVASAVSQTAVDEARLNAPPGNEQQ